MRLLITGAAGGVGTLLRPLLARDGRVLRLLDVAALTDTGDGAELVAASVTDLDAMTAACADVDAVLHLGGLSTEHPWEQILPTNIDGTYKVLEAARRAGVPRVVFASTNHTVGFHPRDGHEAPDHLFPRPDTFYGVSKVAGEALGSLYHDRYGLDVVCLRIGGCFARPLDTRMLETWLSPADAARLVEAALSAPGPLFTVVWGVSDNTRRWWSLAEAEKLGYHPRDDSERYADEVPAADEEFLRYLGGGFCSPELDGGGRDGSV
ncbi:NAD-dependent epimerase/dehydratase family protein [Actinophytocola oryzae]|uniref:NAD-dependent epimerase/dehydratase family protein n=1 Tax=Actinophytocola oryzae TaxID=502181 RepID=A0A4R7W5R7_9PSEU|nr:NAD(P)-dependent oxidoreductase [Actinophytocola oryzae]TDV57329.1 NAD-dependent epimerase/dehydratase family protein [Actinophytocola oryzae]